MLKYRGYRVKKIIWDFLENLGFKFCLEVSLFSSREV